MKNRPGSERGQCPIGESARSPPGSDDSERDPDDENRGSQGEPTQATETSPSLCSFPPSEPMLNISPVWRSDMHRQHPVKFALDDRLDIDHSRTPFNLARNAVCAALSVAEMVPTSTPSAAAMPR